MANLNNTTNNETFSGPWIRASLMKNPLYVPSDAFMKHTQWTTDSPKHLMWKNIDEKGNETTDDAVCIIVGRVSSERLNVRGLGSYKPAYSDSITRSKLQFTLVRPTDDADFVSDYNNTLKRMQEIQNKSEPRNEKTWFIVDEGGKKAMRFSHSVFVKRTVPYDPTDGNDPSNSYPIDSGLKEEFQQALQVNCVSPMVVWDTNNDFIKPDDLHFKLDGALVSVSFRFIHYRFGNDKHTFSALIDEVNILMPAIKKKIVSYSDYTKRVPKLSLSPSKNRPDQIAAVKAFHVGGPSSSVSTTEERSTIPSSSEPITDVGRTSIKRAADSISKEPETRDDEDGHSSMSTLESEHSMESLNKKKKVVKT